MFNLGTEEVLNQATVYLPSIESEDRFYFKKIPITLNFDVPHFTVSGIQVKYLKIND